MSDINLVGVSDGQDTDLENAVLPTEPDLKEGQNTESSLQNWFNAFSEYMEKDIESWQDLVFACALGLVMGAAIIGVASSVSFVVAKILHQDAPRGGDILISSQTWNNSSERRLAALEQEVQTLREERHLIVREEQPRIVRGEGLQFKDSSGSQTEYR